MNGGLAAKVVAVFGDGIEVLLYGYYLQRFGIKADIYFSDSSAPKVASNHIVSTWLCLQRDPFAKKIAVQGVAELREIAIDLGAKMLASEAGSTIFECRPEYVDALGQFADECRAQGLLVEFSRNVRSMGFPLGTLAAIRFLQDVSIYPRTLSGGLIESFVERGVRFSGIKISTSFVALKTNTKWPWAKLRVVMTWWC
ncbi:FAD-dependent oxidoreductase [Pseudomonas sp. TH10]|uniref:FAD-dependent oxidoreductase n=1 Tax=Pseudomonas sp. TH10 TaxID=2796376 RepID=UPI0019126613|nr:FAD-dependent oxidoreductase [Pseudomonas sp. TH10]MBK5516709.1 FAD-binding oxidoreductase [Pseudomonas sp. TH10]